MYVVIFRATFLKSDAEYAITASALREMALRDFGCLEFSAVAEGGREVALSYWPDLASITAWKAQAEHLVAQKQGRARWYTSYRVQIARVERDYGFPRAVP